ncbi:MAG: flagellar basal-body rod protein FlgB [Candidatus Azotimanducaceae bacterium]
MTQFYLEQAMKISFDNALGIHPSAISFRARRAEVIANNLVNADTPGFKARDLRFADVMKSASTPAVTMRSTRSGHMAGSLASPSSELMYRMPLQPSIDGNTVNPETEETNYMRNAIEFQASFTFLNGKFRGMSNAIRGQNG